MPKNTYDEKIYRQTRRSPIEKDLKTGKYRQRVVPIKKRDDSFDAWMDEIDDEFED